MIEISKIVHGWERNGPWYVSPGVDWCPKGNRVIVGDRCWLGNWCSLGDRCSLGDWCTLGNGCTLGDWCMMGNGCTLGDRCSLGNECMMGDEAGWSIDLGFADGYRKTLSDVDGVAYIGAGCRWFTLDDALAHWGNHKENRDLTMCLLQSAIYIAGLRGLKFGELK